MTPRARRPSALRVAALLGLGLGLAVGCRPPAEAPTPPAAPDARVEPTPTEKQEKALANPLHRAHLDAEEPSACRDCHRIEGSEDPLDRATHRCLGCHEDSASVVHAQVADPEARECLSCHEFWAAEADPWACTDCHGALDAPTTERTRRTASVEALRAEASAPRVHQSECQACHAPHGEGKTTPGIDAESCVDCHAEERASLPSGFHHASGEGDAALDEPAACLECHGGHEAGAAAADACAGCHDDRPASVFEGHDRCVDCHRPHAERSGFRACRSCHDDQSTAFSDRHAEHDRCASCHEPHAVVRSAQRRCVTCHEEPATAVDRHPPDEDHGACAGCHTAHPSLGEAPGGPPEQVECAGCHTEKDLFPGPSGAPSDTALHAGVRCQACHQPHRFDLGAAGSPLCASCHLQPASRFATLPLEAEARKEPVLVTPPSSDHGDCQTCHEEGHHHPDAAPKACDSCHEDQRRGASMGHDQCLDCHAPHEGELAKTCLDCHQTKVAMGRHPLQLGECADCHGAHAAAAKPEPSSCEGCHDQPLPLMHNQEGHETCGDCHEFHDLRRAGSRASCAAGECHDGLEDHEPEATKCAGCHPFEGAPKEVWR